MGSDRCESSISHSCISALYIQTHIVAIIHGNHEIHTWLATKKIEGEYEQLYRRLNNTAEFIGLIFQIS
jgi:hypothetical protein